ncbi:MAG: DUF255 domain-containing protein [Planctomycetota bacterium]
MRRLTNSLITLLFVATAAAEDLFVKPEPTDQPSWLNITRRPRHANNQALAKSPHQVRFRSFCAETFAEAAKADKPILLFITADWCHWGKVMERTTFADLEIVTRLNEQFVPVRLNRDERPDVDLRMQQAVQSLGGARGWPLTIFLTPDGRPFFGGTRYSAGDDAALGQTGLRSVIQCVIMNWRENRADVVAQAMTLDAAMKKAGSDDRTHGALAPNLPQIVVEKLKSVFDQKGGGFLVGGVKNAAKFPAPRALELLLIHYAQRGESASLDIVIKTLDAMLSGGIYDQLEGGFHRYTTDRWWRRPCFEKLLIPNAEMVMACLHAWQVTGCARYRQAVEETLNFWAGMSASGGVFFYGSLAADAADDDGGAYFTWTVREIEAALRDDTDCRLAQMIYGIDGTDAEERRALFEVVSPSIAAKQLGLAEADVTSRLARIRKLLLKARQRRPDPTSDRRIYFDGNALMAAAFMECGRVLEKPLYLQRGVAVLEQLLKQGLLTTGNETVAVHVLSEGEKGAGALESEPRPLGIGFLFEGKKASSALGLAQDESALAYACASAYEATGEKRFLDAADGSLRRLDQKFWDKEHGGYFDRAVNAFAELPILQLPIKVFQDTSEPAINALAALASMRLYALTERKEYAERATRIVEAFGAVLEKLGPYGASLTAVVNALQSN